LIILLASSFGFDFTPWPKDNKTPGLSRGLLRIQATFRNEHANRFSNLSYMITLTEDLCKWSILKTLGFPNRLLRNKFLWNPRTFVLFLFTISYTGSYKEN